MSLTALNKKDLVSLLKCCRQPWCILNKNGNFVSFNRYFLTLINGTKQSLKKKTIYDFINHNDRPAVKKAINSKIKKTIAAGLKNKENATRKISWHLEHAPDKKTTCILFEKNEYETVDFCFHKAADICPDPMVITNREGIILYSNEAWHKQTLLSPEKTIGTRLSSHLFSLKNKTLLNKAAKGVSEFKIKRCRIRAGNGGLVPFQLNQYSSWFNKKKSNIVLLHCLAPNDNFSRSQYEFSALSSHQLRTPLSALRWIINMFASGKTGRLNAFQQELIEDAHHCILQMSSTIRSLFMVTQLEGSRLNIDATRITLKNLMNEVMQESEKMFPGKIYKCLVDCPEHLKITSDRSLLREVLSNLIQNAFKYTPEKGQISVRACKDKQGIEIEIADSGYGIPAAEKDCVFDKFFRGSNVTHFETEGSGLGLYLSKGLTSLLGGSIAFDSQENKGSKFKVKIPVSLEK